MIRFPKRLLHPLFLAALGVALTACGGSPTLTVNSANDVDDGTCNSTHCSLREALNKANTLTGTVTIKFNIGGGGAHTIRPKSPLPVITAVVVIDGSTQLGFGTSPLIELDGGLAGAGAVDGLVLSGGGSTVKDLVINSFSGNGIRIEAPGGNHIEKNYIGSDMSGSTRKGNLGNGVLILSDGNHVGGDVAQQGNVISANGLDGVLVDSGGKNSIQGNLIGLNAAGTLDLGNQGNGISVNTDMVQIGGQDIHLRNVISANVKNGVRIHGWTIQVEGNYIGLDVTGTADLGNGQDGVSVVGGDTVKIGGPEGAARNVISGNQLVGIRIDQDSTNVQVHTNLIGTDKTGTVALKNVKSGIVVSGTNHQIGNSIAGSQNLISGNGGAGIAVVAPATGIKIQNNFIGTDLSGMAALGNTEGIEIGLTQGAYDVLIGGNPANEGNLISGNAEEGVLLYNGARVQGDKIGTDATGSGALGNGGDGILSKGDGNLIGGMGFQNTIAFNGGHGVAVITEGGSATGNTISWNSIHDNGGLGIALAQDTVLPNDPGDADTGDNNRQNYPAMISAVCDPVAVDTTFTAVLDSTPNTAFTIEFSSNAACDPSGFGEGHRSVKSMTVTTDAAGHADIVAYFPSTVFDPANFITATATDPGGNTSGFSNCIPVTQPAAATATPAAMSFEPIVNPLEIFYGNCEPNEALITVDIFNAPKPIGYVLLFARLMDKASSATTTWTEGLTMIPAGNNRFYYTLSIYDLPDYDTFADAWLQYQFVVYDADQNKLGYSDVFGNISCQRCEKRGAPGTAATPTPNLKAR
jgi:CSLREA domain-containing protein